MEASTKPAPVRFAEFMFTESAQRWLGCYEYAGNLVVNTNVLISADTYEANDIEIELTRNAFVEWAAVFRAEIRPNPFWHQGPPFQEFSVPISIFEPHAVYSDAVEELLFDAGLVAN